MMGVVSALLAGLAFSLAVVLARKELDESNFFFVAFVITVTGNIILWSLALLFTNFVTINLEGVLFFAMAGILAPGITRLSYFKSVEIMGVSITASIFAVYPMFSSIFAILSLREAPTPENWIGLICIMIGVVRIETSLGKPKTGSRRAEKKGLVFPLLAALAVSISYILRKYGLNVYNEPLLGAAIGYSSSFLLYLLLSIFSDTQLKSLYSSKNFRLFWKAGVMQTLGWVLSFYALRHEKVSIVTPLMQTQPLFVLLLAYLYLKELEHLSFKLVVGTFLIVIGAMLVSIG